MKTNGSIIKTNFFSDLLKSSASLFFVDIEETVLAPNIFYNLVGLENYKMTFLELCDQYNVKAFDCMYYGKNFQRRLMEKNIPNTIKQIRESGKMIFALTSGCPSVQKKDRIKEFGISFNGYLFTKGAAKGPFLINFLKKNNMIQPCAFIDNHLEKLVSVSEHYKRDFFQEEITKPIECYFYSRKYVFTISKNDFVKYWTAVIQSILNGDLEVLKQRIERESLIKRKKRQREQEMIK